MRAKAKRRAVTRAKVVALLSSALLWFALMAAFGAVCAVVGVYLLVGVGWSLLAIGALCFTVAVLIRRGLTTSA